MADRDAQGWLRTPRGSLAVAATAEATTRAGTISAKCSADASVKWQSAEASSGPSLAG